MSDILEKLIGVEKKATELVAEAEAEAGRRKGAARTEAGRVHSDRIRAKAKELDRMLEERKAETAREREQRNTVYLKELAAHKIHRERFQDVLSSLLGLHT
jgi:vacuolar-type H+-ATPase subunit H